MANILFCSKTTLFYQTFSETDIIRKLELLIDNIFAMFDGRVFQQAVGIPMGTNCAPLLADFIRTRKTYRGFHKKKRKVASPIF